MSTRGGEVSYLDISPIQRPWILDSSADGSQLLIFDFEPDVVNDRLQLVPLPNGPPRRIGQVTACNASLTPDARQVLYTQAPNLKQLFIVDVDTDQSRRSSPLRPILDLSVSRPMARRPASTPSMVFRKPFSTAAHRIASCRNIKLVSVAATGAPMARSTPLPAKAQTATTCGR